MEVIRVMRKMSVYTRNLPDNRTIIKYVIMVKCRADFKQYNDGSIEKFSIRSQTVTSILNIETELATSQI